MVTRCYYLNILRVEFLKNRETMCDFFSFEAPVLDAEEEERQEETDTFQPLGALLQIGDDPSGQSYLVVWKLSEGYPLVMTNIAIEKSHL